jgi:hypothetical protein
MQRFFVLLLAALGAPLAAALAADIPSGTVEICRVSRPGDMHKGEVIEIPLGATFGDTGFGADHGGNYWPLWIATTQPLTIAAAESCGKTHARITANLDRHFVRVGDQRWFTPTGGDAGKVAGWPGNLALSAIAVTDFR